MAWLTLSAPTQGEPYVMGPHSKKHPMGTMQTSPSISIPEHRKPRAISALTLMGSQPPFGSVHQMGDYTPVDQLERTLATSYGSRG